MRLSLVRSRLVVVTVAALCALIVVFQQSGSFTQARRGEPALVPNITAVKSISFPGGAGGDVNSDGNADPGDTITYSVLVNNAGTDATGVVFTDTLQSVTTLVGGSLLVSPIAGDDALYIAAGNVRITVPDGAGDLLANDINPLTATNAGLTVTTLAGDASLPFAGTSAQGGQVTSAAADGSFVYNPAPGFTGTDTFTYTVTGPGGVTATGTATFNVSGMIWFVNAAAGGGGDGRLTSPFNCYTGVGCYSAVAADDPGDNIFLYSGAYTGGNTLLASQRLIGQGAGASLSTITGITPPTGSDALPSTGEARPTMTTAIATTNAVNLGSGNTLRGFNIGNTTAADISGTGFGTLTALEIDLNGTGRPLSLTTGTLAATFDTLTSTSAAGGAGVSLTTVGGTLTVSGTTSITAAGTQGISIAGSSVAANFGTSTTIGSATQGILVGTSTGNISFGNTSITAGTDGVSLQNNTAGTRSFGTLSTTNGSGIGFLSNTGGFANVTGQTAITNPAFEGIFIASTTAGNGVTFANVNVTQSGSTGVFLNSNNGAITFADLDISPDAGDRGFHATPPQTAAITSTSGTITTTNAVAVEVVGTSAASRTPLNMQLTSVSANGGTNGIVLTNTSASGAPGGFRVLGTAGSCTVATPTCTGGTIQNSTSHGINLNSVANAVFNSIRVTGADDSGINGATVNGFVLNNSLIDANGNDAATDDVGLEFTDLTGSASGGANPTGITNSVIRNNWEFEVQITNSSGTLTDFQMSGNTISSDGLSANHGNLVNFLALGTASMTLNAPSGTYTGAAPATATGIQCDHSGSSGTMRCNITGGTFTNNNVAVSVSQAQDGNLKFNVTGTTSTGNRSQGLNLFVGAIGTGTVDGSFLNNTVGTLGFAGSGSSLGYGIRVQNEGVTAGGRAVNVVISGNTVQETSSFSLINVNQGIFGQTSSTATNMTITNNTLRNSAARAIVFQQNNTTDADSAGSSCADVSANVMSGIPGQVGDGTYIRLRRLDANSGGGDTFRVRQTSLADLAAQNSITTLQLAIGGTMTYNGGQCTQPVPFAPPAEETATNITHGFNNNLSVLYASYVSPLASFTDVPRVSEVAGVSVTADAKVVAEAKAGEADSHSNLLAATAEIVSRLGEAISPTVYSQERSTVRTKDATPITPESGETITVNGAGAGFTLAAGKSVTITFKATVDAGPYAAGVNNITNTANVTADGGVNVNSNTTSLALDAAPDLTVSASDGAATTQPGGTVAYTLNYSNVTAANGQGASGVTLTETVPINTSFNAAASTAGWVCAPNNSAGSTCTLAIGALAAGGSGSATFAVNVLNALPAGAVQISNTATTAEVPANTNGTDRVPADNSGSDTTPIIGNWLGGTSSDWHTAANWSNATVPPSGNNVSIPAGGNVPTVTTSDVTLTNLVLNGQNLSIQTGRTVTVTGLLNLGINSTDGAGTLDLGSTGTISRTTGQVNSTLNKVFTGNGLFVYPVGTSGAYSPVDVTVTAGTGNLSVRANTGTAPATPALPSGSTLQRYWSLNGSGITADVLWYYLQTDVAGTEANYRIIRVAGTTATAFANIAPCPGAGSRCVDPTANTTFFGGLSTFSNWTAGELAPTAANVGVSGRVLNQNGRGVAFARVALADENNRVVYAITNPFGYYRFTSVAAGQDYVISVTDKRYAFQTRLVTVNDELNDMDFIAEP